MDDGFLLNQAGDDSCITVTLDIIINVKLSSYIAEYKD